MIEHQTNGIRISVVDLPKQRTGLFNRRKCPTKDGKKPEKAKANTNLTMSSYLTMFAAEVLGTGLLMFMGCMGCVTQFDNPPATHHMSGITFGLIVMLIIQMLGHISGAHLNPGVTIASLLMGHLGPTMALVYIAAQFIGGTAGFGLLLSVLPTDYAGDGFCTTALNSKISVLQGLSIEIVITMVLILVCCAVWDKRNANTMDSVGLRFGFVVAAISMAAGPLTGASMNTARSFAPLVFGSGVDGWKNQWIYWIGPNVGAVIACVIYKFLFAVPATNDDDDELTKGETVYLEDVSSVNEKN